MARRVECLCGRTFHVPDRLAECQCRSCGRTWSEVGIIGAVVSAFVGELAVCSRKRGDRRRSKQRPSSGRQTSRRRPRKYDRSGSIANLFRLFGG